ncbi:MAG: HAD family hydrolase [Granulosicoccus sp.]
MSNDKRLIAVDLDGTLLGPDARVSARTSSALHAVANHGHAIVVVTGRSAYSAIPVISSVPACTRVICSNGAYEYDRQNNVKSWSNHLSAQQALHLRELISAQLPCASFGWESVHGLRYEDRFVHEAGGAHTLEQGGDSAPLGHYDVMKLFARTPKLISGDLQKMLAQLIEGQAEVSTSGVPFVELTARGVNKATALARVAAELGFNSDQSIAFGDNLNDLPMLNWAAEGVAMGNAHSDVKKIATTQALDNAKDGVAGILENKLANGQL